MDTGKFVVGQGQVVVKHEPDEIHEFNESVDTENLNPEDLDESKFSDNRKIDCNDLNEAFQLDTIKNEPCEIDIFTECGRCCNGYNNETDVVDHIHATHSFQELSEEKLDVKNENPEDLDHSECSWNLLSTSIGNTNQFKNEECIDIFHEDIKSETDSGLHQLEVQDDSISGDEVTKKQESSAVSQRISMTRTKNGFKMECKFLRKFYVKHLENNVFVEHQVINKAEKKIQCRFCSKILSSKKHLKLHERIHTGEQLFRCKICSKSFNRKEHFTRHESGHTGEKPFQCQVCLKSFTRTDSLKVHLRCHTGEKPFECKICSLSFSRLGNLKVHERIHTGEKPFRCKICSKSFGHMVSLKTHERRHHNAKKPFHSKKLS